MAKSKVATETPNRTTPARGTPRDAREPMAAALTDEELDRVSGGYIGETEKNLRRD
jgi:hypothetical protein